MSDPNDFKMWLAVRRDVAMTPGKAYAQVGHAFGRLYLQASREDPEAFAAYLDANETKITVVADTEGMLLRIEREAVAAGIPCRLIRDAGRSELPPNTATVCAFGPARRSDLPRFLDRLRVFVPKAPAGDGAEAA